MYKLSIRSLEHLDGVHPSLKRVVLRAITLTKTDFGVVCGVRSEAMQRKLYVEKKTKTLRSKHLVQDDGYSHAVDLCCYDDKGQLTYDYGWFRLVIQAMFTAAILEGVPIKAGGLWRTFIDSPHFELDFNEYGK